MKITVQLIKVFILLFLLNSCSEYQKVVRGDDYDKKFAEANRLFDKKNYSRALTLYEQVYQRYSREDKGEVSYFRIAKSYFEEKDYYMAGYYFHQFTQRYPSSESAEEALFMTAICSLKNSPSPSLDQEETETALNDLQLFIQRYPESKLIDSCNNTMDRLRFKIETKKFDAVKLYDKMGENRAAVTAATSFLEDYPRSYYLNEAVFIQFENAYALAIHSILSKKKERIEDALALFTKNKDIFNNKKHIEIKANKYNSDLIKEFANVEEQYAYNDIVKSFESSNSSSKQKKVYYLEETISRFNIFVQNYPESEWYEKAKSIQKKAERELNSIL